MVISGPPPLSALDDDGLARAARRGDREAAAVFFARHRSYLMAAARSIAGTRLDPEDLLSAALVQLLGQWDRGIGPDSNATAYVIRSMRNAAIDESRSPRSRVDTFGDIEDTDPVHAARDDPRYQRAELHEEFAIVRRALERLPIDQRLVLRETVVHGRKPADVAVDAQRSAAAVSSLAARARRGLRRAVLIELLAAGGAECRANADTLPEAVAASPEAHREGERGLAHVRTCPRCRANWSRFAALSSALGILPLLVLSDWTLGAAPASAMPDASSPSSSRDGSAATRSTATDSGPGFGGRAEQAAVAQAPTALTGLGRVAGLARRAAQAPLLVAAAVVLVAGAVVGVTAIALGADDPSLVEVGVQVAVDPASAPEAVFDATVERVGGGAVLVVRFDIPEASWRIPTASFALPADARLRSAPIGWTCSSETGGATCLIDVEDPRGGAFVFVGAAGEPPAGAFSLRLEVETTDGHEFEASADGTFGDPVESPSDGFQPVARLS